MLLPFATVKVHFVPTDKRTATRFIVTEIFNQFSPDESTVLFLRVYTWNAGNK